MARPYLEDLEQLLDQLRHRDDRLKDVTCKHFFSGAAAYCDGQIFMSLSPVGLALKLSAADFDDLFARGASVLRYFPKSPVKKGYAVLPESMIGEHKTLLHWIGKSLDFADT